MIKELIMTKENVEMSLKSVKFDKHEETAFQS
jgi:hypothetical protein